LKPKRHHQIAKDGFVADLRDGGGESLAVDRNGDKTLLEMDLTQFGSGEIENATLKRVFEAASVAEWGLRHALDQFESGAQRILAFIEAQVQVHAADAEGIHFTVEVEVHLASLGHVAVRANPFNEDLLILEFNRNSLVAFRTPQADTNSAFHKPAKKYGADFEIRRMKF
jgi:hypothetical protein